MKALRTAPAVPTVLDPEAKTAEFTSTIVIGSGFSGLATAAELHRQGVNTIVLDCSAASTSVSAPNTGGIDLEALTIRTKLLGLLQHYANRNHLDVRNYSQAKEFSSPQENDSNLWTVTTAHGTVSAQTIVFTKVAIIQLRRMLSSLGIASGKELILALQSLGVYMVGISEAALPTTAEILHQAKRAGKAISARLDAAAPSALMA